MSSLSVPNNNFFYISFNTTTNSTVNSNNSNCNTQIINYNFPNITSVPMVLSDKIEILESKMNSLEKMAHNQEYGLQP